MKFDNIAVKELLVSCGIPDGVEVRVNMYERGHPHLHGETFINRESFVVNIYKGSHVDMESIEKTMRHEFGHIKQVLEGRLVTNGDGKLAFNGQLVTDINNPQEDDLSH